MYRLLLLPTLLLSMNLPSYSQDSIQNAGFESWINNLTYEDPTGWTTLNPLGSLLSVELAFKTTAPAEVHSGSYAAKFVTSMVLTDITPSLLTTGTVNTVENSIDGGNPINSRPDVLSGWYQYAPVGVDTALFHIHLTKWNSATDTTDLVGEADMTVSAATSSWTYFEITIGYLTSDVPDTVQLLFVSSSNTAPQLNSTLLLDDLAYGTQVGIDAENEQIFTLHPNPSSDLVLIQNNEESATLRIYNIAGQLLRSTRLVKGANEISVRDFPIGTYSVEIRSNSVLRATRKLLIQR